MDAKLAEIYKTEENLQNEAEALATLNMAEKLASADELNVDGMSDAEAEALAAQILGGDETVEESAQEEEPAEDKAEETEESEEKTASEKEMQEKIAEAEHLGRVMAHAFVSEKSKIAMARAEKAKTAGKKDPKDGKVMGALKAKKASAEPAEEKMSSLDQLAIARAHEILKENGVELEGQEKQSSINEEQAAQLQEKVQNRAVEILREAGFTFDGDEEQTEDAQ